MPNHDELNNALLNVRRAFRLVHAYQERILGIAQYISKEFNSTAITGYSWYADNKVQGSIDLNSWAFDWLPMYLYEYNIVSRTIRDKLCKFSIVAISDNGFFETGSTWDRRSFVNGFKNEEDSKSLILMMAGEDNWHPGAPKLMHMFLENAAEATKNDSGGVLVMKTYQLSQFSNSSEIDIAIDDFVKFTIGNGMDFLGTIYPSKTETGNVEDALKVSADAT